MAQEVIWLTQAIDDLKSIVDYIGLDSPAYASAVVEEILASAEDLAELPNIGRQVPEWQDAALRERIVYSYRVIYEVQSRRILILAVIHGARMLPDDVPDRSI